MGESIGRNVALLTATLIAALMAAGCSGEDNGSTDKGSTDFPARTLAATPEATSSTTVPPTGTTGGVSEAALRLEGNAGTEFSGFCTIGSEDSVLVGQVPKTYSFDLRGQTLSCRIKKQSSGGDSLRVVLLAGDSTRSIQQTKSQESIINISYSGS
ncbi:hypothetical protein BH24ACT20_BH24ACT20_16720 [soil metagenome]